MKNNRGTQDGSFGCSYESLHQAVSGDGAGSLGQHDDPKARSACGKRPGIRAEFFFPLFLLDD
jgi:hypothetical protein